MDSEQNRKDQPMPRENVPALSQPIQPKVSWFADLPKYAVLAAFVLYAFGFVIWHGYLGQYGVGPPSFWKIEFFSAALCYFTVVIAISLPAALFLGRRFSPEAQRYSFTNADGVSIYPLLFLYAFLLSQVGSLFFGTHIYLDSGIFGSILVILMAAQAGLAIYALIKEIKKKPITSRIVKAFSHQMWFSGLAFLLSLKALLSAPKLNGFIFFSTILLYPSLTIFGGFPVELYWRNFSRPLKSLTFLCAALVLFSHARFFGAKQFGLIPQIVGGGEPLKALLVLGPDQRNLAKLLAVPHFEETIGANSLAPSNANPHQLQNTNSIGGTNIPTPMSLPAVSNTQSFYGPVSILMKSEREIVFFVPTPESKTNSLPHAKLIRSDQVQALEFLNSR
jgi:hypothetical protein